MSASPWNLSFAVSLIVLGAIFGWYERRTAQLLPTISARLRPFLISRTRRRIRIAALFVMIGVLMACGHWTDLHQHPIRFLSIGILTTLFSIALLVYGLADYYATRVQRIEAGRRALERIAEANQAKTSASFRPADRDLPSKSPDDAEST